MSTADQWIGDVLSASKEKNDIAIVRMCGKCCAERDGSLIGMQELRDSAVKAGCVTGSDLAAFLKRILPIMIGYPPEGSGSVWGRQDARVRSHPIYLRTAGFYANAREAMRSHPGASISEGSSMSRSPRASSVAGRTA